VSAADIAADPNLRASAALFLSETGTDAGAVVDGLRNAATPRLPDPPFRDHVPFYDAAMANGGKLLLLAPALHAALARPPQTLAQPGFSIRGRPPRTQLQRGRQRQLHAAGVSTAPSRYARACFHPYAPAYRAIA
jgi:hypothetical protein